MTNEELTRRCMDAEEALEKCSAAFDLIPIWTLERELHWMPSEVALHVLRKAKDALREFESSHWHRKGSLNDTLADNN